MSGDLYLAENLSATGKGSSFYICERDTDRPHADGHHMEIDRNGGELFGPKADKIRSGGARAFACLFIDADYDEDVWATAPTCASRSSMSQKSGGFSDKRASRFADEAAK